MKNMLLRFTQLCLVALMTGYAFSAYADYKSTYESIEWNKRKNHDYYCIDIVDADAVNDTSRVNPWLQAVKCDKLFFSFSPKAHVEKMLQDGTRKYPLSPGQKFGWRVFSKQESTDDWNYGEEGYSGIVEVPRKCAAQDNLPHVANDDSAQWGCRNDDDYYTLDVFDEQGKNSIISDYCSKGSKCGTNIHKFDLAKLELGVGTYMWKVWSPSGGAPGGTGFEGKFVVTASSKGKALFSEHCMGSGCHSNAKDSNKIAIGANWSSIRAAIDQNKGTVMGKLKLTNEQLQQIAEYIKEINK